MKNRYLSFFPFAADATATALGDQPEPQCLVEKRSVLRIRPSKSLTTLSLSIVLSALCLAPRALAAAPRVEVSLNAAWQFHLGDTPGAEAITFNDASWS